MAHYKTVNRWLEVTRELSRAVERLQDDIQRLGQPPFGHLEQARLELLLAIEEIKLGGAEGTAGRGV